MPKNAAVIVAAGRGERLGVEGGPKQYRLLGKASVLQQTIDCFRQHADIDLIQVVIHRDDEKLYDKAVSDDPKLSKPVFGGATRQASCKAGIDAVLALGAERVLVHDAARPFLSQTVITNVLCGIKSGKCALPAIAVADTVKKVNEDRLVLETIDRNNLYLAQTPQGFVANEIADAHAKAEQLDSHEFTDDAAVAEWFGMQVLIVEGDINNFKITTQDDLINAQERLNMQNTIPDIRTGTGYDVHTLGPGDGVILCGVKLPHDKSLQGHSDADVGLHSLTDALLGTIGAGDIGSHFPPSDPKWKGADSDQFLAHAVKEVSLAGGTINNLDVTIICEAPKIGPHRETMRQRVAEICQIEVARVSVKATTNERIGFIGREEGIAAVASASVAFPNRNQG